MNKEHIWKDRFNVHLKETGKYLKYIFNGHLVFVIIILLGGAGYYYSEWVKTLTPEFPSLYIMAVILGILMTVSPISTFFREPDMVFLLPIETRLGSYIKKSWVYSLALQVYLLVMVLAVLMPMYIQTRKDSAVPFIWLLVVLLVQKGINLAVRWFSLYYREKSSIMIDSVVRFLINAVLIYFLCAGASPIFSVILILLLAGLGMYYYKNTRQLGFNWAKLIELEVGRMSAFYRIANLFTDVPKLKDKIAERRWLNGLLKLFPNTKENPFGYMYARTFLRANDYLGLFVRLTVIAVIIFLFASLQWGNVFLAVLFIYITGLQLLPIWHHHDHKIIIELYPFNIKERQKAVLDLLTMILMIQNLVFFVAILIGSNIKMSLVALAGGFILIALFRPYAMKKMQSEEA